MGIIEGKSKRLQWVAQALHREFGEAIVLVDNWPEDTQAIGVARPGTEAPLVYVSSIAEARRELFTVAFEHPPLPGSDLPYEQGDWHHDVDLDTAMQLVSAHLGLARGAA